MKPIGVFDSGYGGLTVLRQLVNTLPQYDYLYLGDNARAPYGSRSFETVYRYTLQCVQWLLAQDCPLIILACNTASAKALRTIQQKDMKHLNPDVRVLGVIRPTTEIIGNYTQSKNIGILATAGTVQSRSYLLEIEKFFPEVTITQEACPIWVPLVESSEHLGEGADYFVQKHVAHILTVNPKIDTLLLACTHYPLLKEKIQKFLPEGITVIGQGEIVANSLNHYLHRHPQLENAISKNGKRFFYTTDATADFDAKASLFFEEEVTSQHADLK